MDLVTTVLSSTLSPGLLVAVAVLLIFRGELVTRKSYDEMRTILHESLQVERAAHDRAMTALSVLLLEHGTTMDKVLSSLPVPKGETGETS